MNPLKIQIEVDELAGCQIFKSNNTDATQWEDLDRSEQIRVINALGQFYALFYRAIKNE